MALPHRPRLALIQTGGTIASRPDPGGAGLTPVPSGAPDLPGVEVIPFSPFILPSPHVTPQHMLALRDLIEGLPLSGPGAVDGAVITHGTDTLEETAFFLHLTLRSPLPVVLTGSMRHAGEVSWDGPGNVWAAAQVALHPQTRGRGPLVVFSGEIYDARTVTKVHSSAVDAFGGYPGPIGRVDHGPARLGPGQLEMGQLGPGQSGTGQAGVGQGDLLSDTALRYFAGPYHPRPSYAPQRLDAHVEVLYAYAGWQGEGYAEAEARSDGLVIAALGTGNLPAPLLPLIAGTRKPVVIATRTHAGPILPLYGYQGGGATLARAGAIPASFLNAHKARLLLLLLLSLGMEREEIRRIFGEGLF